MKQWYIVDAQGKTLGRLAASIANVLRWKHKPQYLPYVDNGDYVIVINADKFVVTGNKMQQKLYRRHTGYAGGLKETTLAKMLTKKPTFPLEKAVAGMIPYNKLKAPILAKLKLYTGSEHPHAAQNPKPLEV